MIAVVNTPADRCCTCGHFPRFGYYVVGFGDAAKPQCRECYELISAREMRRSLGVVLTAEEHGEAMRPGMQIKGFASCGKYAKPKGTKP